MVLTSCESLRFCDDIAVTEMHTGDLLLTSYTHLCV